MKLMALELRRPLRGLTTVYAARNTASKGFDPMIVRLKLQQIRVMRWSDPNLLIDPNLLWPLAESSLARIFCPQLGKIG
jgi:hypothetical protein